MYGHAILFLCGTLIITAGTSSGQGVDLAVAPLAQSVLPGSGLVGRYSFQVEVDSTGVVWVASSVGISRFDGRAWTHFAHDLPSAFARAVLSARDGRVWVGTDRGIALGDRNGFQPLPEDSQPPAANVRRLRQAPDGSIWVASDSWLQPDASGGVTRYGSDGKRTGFWSTPALHTSRISDFQFRNERVFVLTGDGIVPGSGGGWEPPIRRAGRDSLGNVWAVEFDAQGEAWVSSDQGLFHGPLDRLRRLPQADRFMFIRLFKIGSRLFALGDSGEVFRLIGNRMVPTAAKLTLSAIAEDVAVGPDGTIWIVGRDLLMRWPRQDPEWLVHPGLSGLALVDGQQRLWVSGEQGTLVRTNGNWVRIDEKRGALVDGEGLGVWRFGSSMAERISPTGVGKSLDLPARGIRRLRQLVVAPAADKVYLVGEAADGKLRIVSESMDGAWVAWDLVGVRFRDAVAGPGGGVAILTDGRPGEITSIVLTDAVSERRLEGPAVTSLTPARITRGRDGRVWLFGDFGLLEVTPNGIRSAGLPSRSVQAVDSDSGRVVAVSTSFLGEDSGVWSLMGERWHLDRHDSPEVLPRAGGGLVFRDRGRLYAVGREGHAFEVFPPGGIPDSVVSAISLSDGALWVEQGRRVLEHPREREAPLTLLPAREYSLATGDSLVLHLEARIPYGPASSQGFRFSYQLDSGPWSDWLSSPVVLNSRGLSAGQYRLSVRSRRREGPVEFAPVSAPLRVRPIPLQDRALFIPTLVGMLAMALFLAASAIYSRIRLREFNHQLEDTVEIRTRDIRAMRDRLNKILDEAPIAYVVVDEEGKILRWNRAAEKLFGWAESEVIGRQPPIGQDADRLHQFRTLLGKLVGGEQLTGYRMDRTDRFGRMRSLEVSTARTYDPSMGQQLLIGMVVDVSEREESQRALKELSLRLVRIQEQERAAIARDIHDEAGGLLTTLLMSLNVSKMSAAPDHRPTIDQQIDLVRQLVNRLRLVSDSLRPGELDGFGLESAVSSLVARLSEVGGLHVRHESNLVAGDRLNRDVETVAYRIIQESLTNVARHSGVLSARIRIDRTDSHLSLEISDAGKGFATDRDSGGTLGLKGMQERAKLVGGEVEIESLPGRGTTVRATLPLERESGQA